MPKRVLHGEAMWTSTKLSECPEWSIPFYAWIYPLADANGSFELTNLRVVWSQVGPILPTFTQDVLADLLRIFHEHGLLFIWEQDGKKYGHWVGSEKKGRLPQPTRRTARYGPLLAPAVPAVELQRFEVRQRECRIATAKVSSVLVLDLVSDLDLEGKPAPASRPPDTHHQACYDFAYESFRRKHGTPPSWSGKDQKNLKTLLKSNPALTVGEFSRRWDFYLASTESFIAKQGDSLAFFCSRFDSFIDGPLTNAAGKEHLGGKPSATELALHNARGLGFNGKPN